MLISDHGCQGEGAHYGRCHGQAKIEMAYIGAGTIVTIIVYDITGARESNCAGRHFMG